MKQTVYYLKPGGNSQFGPPRNRGLGMIRDARARNVKAFFGLWVGIFAFTAVWALIDFAKYGLAGMQDSVWAQLVVLCAALIFYMSSKQLRHHRTGIRVSALPVSLSLIACCLTFAAVVAHSGAGSTSVAIDTGFWSAIQNTQRGSYDSSNANLEGPPTYSGYGTVIHTLDPKGSEVAA